jgi:hypothetical protein
MTLGPDRAVCLTRLQNELRPIAGDAVAEPPALANLEALAQALYALLTQSADVTVSQTGDPAFWTWLTNVGTAAGAGPPPASFRGKIT